MLVGMLRPRLPPRSLHGQAGHSYCAVNASGLQMSEGSPLGASEDRLGEQSRTSSSEPLAERWLLYRVAEA